MCEAAERRGETVGWARMGYSTWFQSETAKQQQMVGCFDKPPLRRQYFHILDGSKVSWDIMEKTRCFNATKSESLVAPGCLALRST